MSIQDCFSCFHLFFPPKMYRNICKRRQQNMKWRSLITIVFLFSFGVLPFFFSLFLPFFFPYQWSRDSKDKTHEVDIFQVPSFCNFLLGNYPKTWKNAKKNKVKNVNNIVILHSILQCKSKGRSRAWSTCLDFLFIFLLLTKKRKVYQKMNSIIYFFSSCSFLFILLFLRMGRNKYWKEA